jgi:hypothetical protein
MDNAIVYAIKKLLLLNFEINSIQLKTNKTLQQFLLIIPNNMLKENMLIIFHIIYLSFLFSGPLFLTCTQLCLASKPLLIFYFPLSQILTNAQTVDCRRVKRLERHLLTRGHVGSTCTKSYSRSCTCLYCFRGFSKRTLLFCF